MRELLDFMRQQNYPKQLKLILGIGLLMVLWLMVSLVKDVYVSFEEKVVYAINSLDDSSIIEEPNAEFIENRIDDKLNAPLSVYKKYDNLLLKKTPYIFTLFNDQYAYYIYIKSGDTYLEVYNTKDHFASYTDREVKRYVKNSIKKLYSLEKDRQKEILEQDEEIKTKEADTAIDQKDKESLQEEFLNNNSTP